MIDTSHQFCVISMSRQQSEASLLDENSFNRIIFECVDRALLTLGEATELALFELVNEKYGLPRIQFSQKPLEVTMHLRETLGDLGFAVIQKLIIREIRKTFDLKQSSSTLEDAIAESKTRYLYATDRANQVFDYSV
jgi:hypothetical protein